MTNDDWDAWRSRYDLMSFSDQQEFYDRVAREHPTQQHFSIDAFGDCLDQARPDVVVELGGWKGELAAATLNKSPITRWTNYEISRVAVQETVCKDPRYVAVALPHYLWEYPVAIEADLFVASHVLEHLKVSHVLLLMSKVKAAHVYVEAPLPRSGVPAWKGYFGSHVLEVGWDGLGDLMGQCGYRKRWYVKDSMMFSRRSS